MVTESKNPLFSPKEGASLQNPIVIIGLGQLGETFSKSWHQLGYPIVPVRRRQTLPEAFDQKPQAVLIATGERDLPSVLATLSPGLKDRAILLQNELVPRIWAPYLTTPTLAAIWFEKKPGITLHSLRPSVAYGPQVHLLSTAFEVLNQPLQSVDTYEHMVVELMIKNTFILATNIYGLVSPGPLKNFISPRHRTRVQQLLNEICPLQSCLTGLMCPVDRTSHDIWEVIAKNAELVVPGRSALDRLHRTITTARQSNLFTPELDRIARQFDSPLN